MERERPGPQLGAWRVYGLATKKPRLCGRGKMRVGELGKSATPRGRPQAWGRGLSVLASSRRGPGQLAPLGRRRGSSVQATGRRGPLL